MHFTGLRLSGFKSFVDPAELRIEPGLTGIVGPNGCGKSNMLEALRWVMGAGSAKAMRGEGMDDVIFGGAGARPARNLAEVTLTIDNAVGDAPPAFADQPVIEVTRRIDRGAGSTYRINGVEARARDVQLLFADASTGANSPALVRQGQIAELIAARPENRRRVLEEAAGVSGLHGRRHEAELKVSAAETNLARLDDVRQEMEGQLARFRREARQATRYRALAAEIRTLREAVARARWRETRVAAAASETELDIARRSAEETARGAASAAAEAAATEAALPALRDEAAVAASVLHRLDIARDRLERAMEAATAEVARLATERSRLAGDQARESQIGDDAAAAIARLDDELGGLARAASEAPERLPLMRAAAAAADAERDEAQAAVEALASRVAAMEAASATLALRADECAARLARNQRALDQARAERAAAPAPDVRADAAEAQLRAAEGALLAARAAVEAREQRRDEAAADEIEARQAMRATDDRLSTLESEARGLAKLVEAASPSGHAPALSGVTSAPGFEAALAAALGEDLDAALDPSAPAHWRGAEVAIPVWPLNATPLADKVRAPPALAARLAFIALVSSQDGPRLQAGLPPGARLVSREGDLWRWDGFTVAATAPRPAQVRLEQAGRLAELRRAISAATPAAAVQRRAHADALAALSAADSDLAAARPGPRRADSAVVEARARLEDLRRETARREARLDALAQLIAGLEKEGTDLATQAKSAGAEAAGARPEKSLAEDLAQARTRASSARGRADAARAALDGEAGRLGGLAQRDAAAAAERREWLRRSGLATERLAMLAAAGEQLAEALSLAEQQPSRVALERDRLLDELETAEARRRSAADALATAEAVRHDTQRAARAAQARAAEARERRVGAEVRLEAAGLRLAEFAQAYADIAGRPPKEMAGHDVDTAAADESRLPLLERERDALGAVNLRAEEEAAELAGRLETMAVERADLDGAMRRLRSAIAEINREGQERLMSAFGVVDGHFRSLFATLFQGGEAHLRLVESDDPLEAGLEIHACPPGKRMAVMSLMSGGEQALTAVALIFAVFLANPAPLCVLDEVDAPLDDANVERFCDLLDDMRHRAATRFLTITHNPLTMSRMDRLYGVTMRERGVSQLVSVDLSRAEAMAAR